MEGVVKEKGREVYEEKGKETGPWKKTWKPQTIKI
jgi:hypothetical protein